MVHEDGSDVAPAAKERLLAAVVEYVAQHGVGGVSLRQLANAVGTSHRMLIYHFGSKEALLVEVVRSIERRERSVLGELRAELDPGAGPSGVIRDMWHRLADEAQAPYERLFFELYGRALQDEPGTAELLDGIVESWLPLLTALGERTGLDASVARAQARLQLAVARGLLLDLLATGDHGGVDEAVELFAGMCEDVATRGTYPSRRQ